MVVAPGMLVNAGKKLMEACRLCRTCAIHVPLLPAQPIRLARRKGLQLLSSFLYCFPLSHLDRTSMGAEVGRFEHFVFLYLVCWAFCFCFFLTVIFGDFYILAREPESYVSFFN